jgi:hypothetical protein
MNKWFGGLLKKMRGPIASCLLVLAAVSGYFTYQGAALVLDAAGGGWENRVSAAVFAVGVSTGIYLFWTLALNICPMMPTGKTRATATAITGVGCLFLVSLSSWLNVTALAGAGALEVHMKQSLMRFEEALDASYRRAMLAEQLVPDLEVAAARYARLAAAERSRGALTGIAGSGGIAETLQGASEQIGGVIQTIRSGGPRRESMATKAGSHLQKMRDIVGGPGPATVRMQAMAAQADKLRAALSEMNSQALIESVSRTMAGLSTSIAQRATSTAAHIAQAQRDAWARIQEDLSKTGEAIASAANQIASLPPAPVPVFERISVVQAVLQYGADFIPYWAGGMALDLCPTLIIAFLMLARAVRDGDGPGGRGFNGGDRVPPGIGGLTVQDLIDARKALETLQGKDGGKSAGEEDLDKMLGFDRNDKKYRH